VWSVSGDGEISFRADTVRCAHILYAHAHQFTLMSADLEKRSDTGSGTLRVSHPTHPREVAYDPIQPFFLRPLCVGVDTQEQCEREVNRWADHPRISTVPIAASTSPQACHLSPTSSSSRL
jgi:hypothetical protein